MQSESRSEEEMQVILLMKVAASPETTAILLHKLMTRIAEMERRIERLEAQ